MEEEKSVKKRAAEIMSMMQEGPEAIRLSYTIALLPIGMAINFGGDEASKAEEDVTEEYCLQACEMVARREAREGRKFMGEEMTAALSVAAEIMVERYNVVKANYRGH